MELIRETIAGVLKNLGEKHSACPTEDLGQALKKCLTARELRHIRCSYLLRDTAHIALDSSGWMYQFSLTKEALLVKLRKAIPQVHKVHFYIGETR